jgi:hypothetical protein
MGLAVRSLQFSEASFSAPVRQPATVSRVERSGVDLDGVMGLYLWWFVAGEVDCSAMLDSVATRHFPLAGFWSRHWVLGIARFLAFF